MRKFMKLKLFFMVTVVFSVVFSFAAFADTQILPTVQLKTDILPLENINVNYMTLKEKSEFVYNNEIILLSPVFSQNFQNIFLHSVKVESSDGEVFFINLPEYSYLKTKDLKDKNLFNIHYELDENGEVHYIARDEENLYVINLSSSISSLFSYSLKEDKIPSWIDIIYTEEEMNEKTKEKPLFDAMDKEKIVYDDTIYQVVYDGNEFSYFNTKKMSFEEVSFPLISSVPSSFVSLQFFQEKLDCFFSDNSFVIFNKEELIEKVKKEVKEENKEENKEEVTRISEKIKEELKKKEKPSLKEAFKEIKENKKVEEKEEVDKKVLLKKKKKGMKIKKVISFNKDNSSFKIKKDKLYVSLIREEKKKKKAEKIEYSLEISEEEGRKILKGKTIKGVVEKTEKEQVNFKEIDDKIIFNVPNDIEGCKSRNKTYMPYTAVTSKTSNQYKLLYDEKAYTDKKTDIRMYEGRYCIAVGTAYTSEIGTKIDVVLENGDILNCILGDVKSDAHTDPSHQFHAIDGSVVEFVVDYNFFNRKDHILNTKYFRQEVKEIIVEK